MAAATSHFAAGVSDRLTGGRPTTPRRAEVRVGSLAAFDPVLLATEADVATGLELASADSNMPDVIRSACNGGSFRRPQGRRSASTIVTDHLQQPKQLVSTRRPRAVPVRRLTARRPCCPALNFFGTAVFANAPFVIPAATVQLDLTGIKGVRAEVAFSGAAATAALSEALGSSDSAASESDESDQRSQTVYFHGLGGGRFVQVQNPLCVPRSSDYLSTWRTCMVPISDLENCELWLRIFIEFRDPLALDLLKVYSFVSMQFDMPSQF